MKKILLLAVLLMQSGFLLAQNHPKIQIRNNTSCPVYFQLRLSQPHPPSGGSCIPDAGSTVISVPAFGIIDYHFNNTPGIAPIPPPDYRAFLYASILNGPPGCATTAQVIGQPCAVAAGSWSYLAMDATCGACGIVNATWSVGGGIIQLEFNP